MSGVDGGARGSLEEERTNLAAALHSAQVAAAAGPAGSGSGEPGGAAGGAEGAGKPPTGGKNKDLGPVWKHLGGGPPPQNKGTPPSQPGNPQQQMPMQGGQNQWAGWGSEDPGKGWGGKGGWWQAGGWPGWGGAYPRPTIYPAAFPGMTTQGSPFVRADLGPPYRGMGQAPPGYVDPNWSPYAPGWGPAWGPNYPPNGWDQGERSPPVGVGNPGPAGPVGVRLGGTQQGDEMQAAMAEMRQRFNEMEILLKTRGGDGMPPIYQTHQRTEVRTPERMLLGEVGRERGQRGPMRGTP